MIRFARQLWSIVWPYRSRLIFGVWAGVLCGLIEPLLMVSVKLVVDALFPTATPATILKLPEWAPTFIRDFLHRFTVNADSPGRRPETVLCAVALIPGVMFLRGLLAYLNVYCLQWAAIRAVTDLRARLFTHLFGLPLRFFHRTSTGELMSRILSDVGTLHHVLSHSVATIIKDPVTLVSLLVFLLWQQPRLTLAALVVLPVCVGPIMIYSRRVRRSARKIQSLLADLSKLMHEAFSGVRIIQAYNLEPKVSTRFAETARRYVGQYMRLVRAMEIPGPLIEFVGASGVALLLLYVALSARNQTPTPGDLVMVVASLFAMYRPLKNLIRLHQTLTQARAASERVFQLLAVETDLKPPAQPVALHATHADIEFDHVHFAYDTKPVLRDIHLHVQAGTMVALVGASGAGKTTLTNLLLRFYDPQRGAVRIGGVDVRDVSLADLRRQIAVVTQEVILFNDTIRNNIALGRPAATEREIITAAQLAHAHDFILKKPKGYDTVIGEKGAALSGGEQQRIAIARALLKDAPILVLDEATSALDTESERAIQAALGRLMQGRTTICIAHRLSTVQRADLIVVLDRGRIVEQGRHAELLGRGGLYRKLYELQFQT